MDRRALRRRFIRGLPACTSCAHLSAWRGLIVGWAWPFVILEGWSVQESINFLFVTGLTIGYGDLAPKTPLTRALAILIGVRGILLTALVAAFAVQALTLALRDPHQSQDDDGD